MMHATSELLAVLVPLLLLASANEEPTLVLGVVNRSIELSAHLHLPHPVQETVWKFKSGNVMVKMAEVGNMKLLFYSNQFNNRIKTVKNGTTIVIEPLSLRDTGEYQAEIILTNKQIHRVSFKLTVY
ncbi:hypothetical protein GDO81_027052, partial [Engystomops pustulosus]